MAVKIEEKPIIGVEPSGKRIKKEKYRTSDLPFPPVRASSYMAKWRKEYKATIIDWAGSVTDPFGTNSRLDVPEGPNSLSPLERCWMAVYPDLKLCMKDQSQKKIVVSLVSGQCVHRHTITDQALQDRDFVDQLAQCFG